MPTVIPPKPTDWNKRIERARHLTEKSPAAAELLLFYCRVLECQKTLHAKAAEPMHAAPVETSTFREHLDCGHVAQAFPALLVLVREEGPAKLSQEAGRLQQLPATQLRQTLESFLQSPDSRGDAQLFFARILFEPYAERIAQAWEGDSTAAVGPRCPLCGSGPQVAVIRPEGDGGKRSLVCWLCHTEWEFRRILCPGCGEEHNEKLPRYSAEGTGSIRIEGCDTCKRYLKSVDMTVDGLAVPLVDELAAAPLDLWAAEKGYAKLHLNILGF